LVRHHAGLSTPTGETAARRADAFRPVAEGQGGLGEPACRPATVSGRALGPRRVRSRRRSAAGRCAAGGFVAERLQGRPATGETRGRVPCRGDETSARTDHRFRVRLERGTQRTDRDTWFLHRLRRRGAAGDAPLSPTPPPGPLSASGRGRKT